VTGVLIAALVIGLPALAFTLWPLFGRRSAGRGFLALPPDAREQLEEQKRAALRTLRELEFEHASGHISDEDHAELRARYEAEAAQVLGELDRLGAPAPAPPRPAAAPGAKRSAWQHPAALAASAVLLLAFGAALGAGIVRHTAPDPNAGMPMAGSRPLADLAPAPAGGGADTGVTAPPGQRTVTPEVLQGMLGAARSALFEGRYSEAIAAYQAILKRDPRNVDAITHLALIVAVGGHADTALESLDKALAIDPDYPPALLYRGQILYEAKQDRAGAIRAWEKYLEVAPAGEDRQRVEKLLAEAKARPAATR
jgi:tetratricopeptide (TPR) repeat protein